MANYANLLATIAANIYTNGNNEVTAAMVKAAVDQMVASLGDGYQYRGIVSPSSAVPPGSADLRVFCFASEKGTYTNFIGGGGTPIEITEDGLYVLKHGAAWYVDKVLDTGDMTAAAEAIFGDSGLLSVDISGTDYQIWAVKYGTGIQWTNSWGSSRAMRVVPIPATAKVLHITQPNPGPPFDPQRINKLVFLKDVEVPVAGQYANICDGEVAPWSVADGANEFIVPAGCRAIAFGTLVSDTDVTPTAISVYAENLVDRQNALSSMVERIDTYGYTVSDYTKEKLAHISNMAFLGGYFFIPYVADETQPAESYAAYTNFVRLAVVPLCNPAAPLFFDVAKAGDVIGGVTIESSVTSPHDPAIALKGGYAYIIFRACVGGKAVELCRRFDIFSMALENSLTQLTLDSADFDNAAVVSAYNSLTGASVPSIQPQSMDMNSNIILASDGLYYAGVGGVATNFYGIIVRSSNLVDWESVAANNLNLGTCSGEVNLCEMTPGVLLVAYRDQDLEKTIIMTYTIATGTWSTHKIIDESIRARPCPFQYDNEALLAINVQGPDATISGYGTAIRQNLAIYKVDTDLKLTLLASYHRDCSIQYPALVAANENLLWMCFSTDTRHIAAAQGRSNIELKNIVL